MSFDLKLLDRFPSKPGVYLMKNEKGEVIYVGKAKNLKNRVKQYFFSQADTRVIIPFLVDQTTSIDTLIVPSEKEALLLENTLIKKHQPKFNAVLKDDKTFISLMINSEDPWPQIRLVRYKGSAKEKGLYFGPYTSALAAKKTFELLCRLFPLRQCSNEEFKRRTRPCILHSIKRCLAPCVGKCTKEEYDLFVQGTIRFLKGENKEVLKQLHQEMQAASEQLEFERAAKLLHTINQVEHVLESESLVAKATGKDQDALGLYRQGNSSLVLQLFFRGGKLIGSKPHFFDQSVEEDDSLLSSFILQHYSKISSLPELILTPISLKHAPLLEEVLSDSKSKKVSILTPKRRSNKALLSLAQENAKEIFYKEKDPTLIKEQLLFEMQMRLKLIRYPRKIACFDTSHIAGSDPVAAAVIFTEGIKTPKEGRLFKIKSASKGDDYAALKEVLERYLIRAKREDTLPDLIIVDGGKGQLSQAAEVLKALDIIHIDLIALTKEQGRHDKGLSAERVFLREHHDPIALNTRSSLLFFLQNIRDEAHKKALSFHHKRRRGRHLTSKLDTITGIGPIKKKRLLQAFGSFKRIQEASEEELLEVKGITKKDIQTIHSTLLNPSSVTRSMRNG